MPNNWTYQTIFTASTVAGAGFMLGGLAYKLLWLLVTVCVANKAG